MEKNEKNVKMESAEEKDRLLVPLSKTYHFEGEDIEVMDLRGLRDVRADDMIKVSRMMALNGNVYSNEETSLEYACNLAGSVTGRPIEFYKALEAPDAISLKNRVSGFLFGVI